MVCIFMLVGTPVREERSDWRDKWLKVEGQGQSLEEPQIVYD